MLRQSYRVVNTQGSESGGAINEASSRGDISTGSQNPSIPAQTPEVINAQIDALKEMVRKKKHSALLRFCKLMNVVTGLAALLSLFAQPNIITSSTQMSMSVVESVVRCYGVLFCCLAILTETEWSRFFVHFLFLESWLGRGLFYVLIGVMVLPFDGPREASEGTTGKFRLFCSYFFIFCGVLYFVLGLLCFHYLKELQMNRIMQIQKAEEEMSDLALRQQEIERLLQETESKLMNI